MDENKEDVRMCGACRWKDYVHNKAGMKIWCRKEQHKITKGKWKCKNFQWN